jgi:transcription elongation factor GreA
MDNCFSNESLKKLKEELEYLKTEKRKEIAEALRHAISFGDLSENAAYTEAKEAQSFLEGRILELEQMIRDVKTADYGRNIKTGFIVVGSIVELESGEMAEKLTIVYPNEANPLESKISSESPLGKAMLGKLKGDVFSVETPAGKINYKILKVE